MLLLRMGVGMEVEVAVAPPGDAVTVSDVMADPPVSGACQLTVAWRF